LLNEEVCPETLNGQEGSEGKQKIFNGFTCNSPSPEENESGTVFFYFWGSLTLRVNKKR